MEYPKIQTLYKREEIDGKRKGKIIKGDFTCPEFVAIKTWDVSEKINGMNARIHWNSETNIVEVLGRTDDAMLPSAFISYIYQTFTPDKFKTKFEDAIEVWLFGEGYGAGIQKGGIYSPDKRFIMFDAYVKSLSGNWWLERFNVQDIAFYFGVPAVYEWMMTMEDAIRLVKNRQSSILALRNNQNVPFEGIVCRSNPLLLFRNGDPLMWKLKVRDFE